MQSDSNCKKDKKQRSGSSKVVNLVFRSLHVGAASILFGGLILSVPFSQLSIWHTLAIATGGALIIAEACRSRHWVYQVRGLMATVHVGLLGLIHFRPELMAAVLTTVLMFGVIGSNMPGYVRHWSAVHGRRVD